MQQEKSQPLPSDRYFLELGRVPEALSFTDIWGAIAARKRTIRVVVAIFVGIFALLAAITPVKYKANVVIAENQLSNSQSSGSGSSSQSDNVAIGVEFTANEAIAMITSRGILSRYIEDHNLLPILFAADWDSKSESWAPRLWRRQPTVLAGYKKMVANVIGVNTDIETSLTSVEVKWTDPVLAQTWANSIVAEVNDLLRNRAIAEAEESLGYLERELQVINSVELQQSLFELIKVQKAKIVAANVHHEYAFRLIDAAVVPEEPSPPYQTVILLAVGAIIGIFMGVTLALLLNLIQTAKKSRVTKLSPDAG